MRCLELSRMRRRFDYDGALKELIQHGRPALLSHLTGGVPIMSFLNVELPEVQGRRVDLLLQLADDSILHLEFQSRNDRSMLYRVAGYHILIVQRYRKAARHVVLYVGQPPMRMASRLDTGPMQFACEMLDIREIAVEEFLRSGTAADYALAILGGGAEQRVPEILRGISKLRAGERSQALAQFAILCGLRPLSDKLRMEVGEMPVIIEIANSPMLVALQNKALEQGREQGLEQGRAEGYSKRTRTLVRELLQTKFGNLPRWAVSRLTRASTLDLENWAKKLITAPTLEEVLGPRNA